jgi:L-lactate utilization protein LutB
MKQDGTLDDLLRTLRGSTERAIQQASATALQRLFTNVSRSGRDQYWATVSARATDVCAQVIQEQVCHLPPSILS